MYKLVSLSTLSHPDFLAKGEYILLSIKTHHLAQEESHPPFPTQGEMTESFNFYRNLNHAAENRDRVMMAQRDAARKVCEDKFHSYGTLLLMRSNGDPMQLLGSGYEVQLPKTVKKTPTVNDTLLAPLAPVARHIIVAGQPVAGKFLIKWNTVPGSNAFEVQMTDDPSDEASFKTCLHTSHSRDEVPGVSGTRYYIRVRVLIGKKEGPWSEVVNILCL